MATMSSVDLVDFLKAVLLVVVFQVEEVPQDRFPLSQKILHNKNIKYKEKNEWKTKV